MNKRKLNRPPVPQFNLISLRAHGGTADENFIHFSCVNVYKIEGQKYFKVKVADDMEKLEKYTDRILEGGFKKTIADNWKMINDFCLDHYQEIKQGNVLELSLPEGGPHGTAVH